MSFAVIENGNCIHVGEDATSAAKIFESKPNSKLIRVANLEELETALKNEDTKTCVAEDGVSDFLHQLLNKLDENGINAENADEFRKKLQSDGGQLVAEVRSLGIRGMRVVSDGLSALGDFMRSAAEDIQSTEEEHDCCGGGSCEHKHKPE